MDKMQVGAKAFPFPYWVIDAFTESAFKGNPAAVCLVEEEKDGEWLQSVAKECNFPITSFLRPAPALENGIGIDANNTRFHLRWFSPVAEVKICGHGTLAAAHFLFTCGLSATNTIEFITKSGLLTAKRIDGFKQLGSASLNDKKQECFTIELDLPIIPVIDCISSEVPSIPRTLNGASVLNVKKTSGDDFIVELQSAKAVADLKPQFDEIQKCPGKGVIVTGLAPHGSGFDFFTRFFCPKFGVNEDQVCASAHCSLAPYWSKKLGKHDLISYMASPRGGVLEIHLQEETKRVLIRGRAVTVMTGSLLV